MNEVELERVETIARLIFFFFETICITGVQARGPDQSQTSCSAMSCDMVVLLGTSSRMRYNNFKVTFEWLPEALGGAVAEHWR
jgi:hypothetical protein